MGLFEHELCLLEAILPVGCEPLFPLIVLHESADLRFGELQVPLRFKILRMPVDMLLQFERGLDQVLQVLRDLRHDLVLRKDLGHCFTGCNLHVRHRVLITKDHPDFTRGFLPFCKLEDPAFDFSGVK